MSRSSVVALALLACVSAPVAQATPPAPVIQGMAAVTPPPTADARALRAARARVNRGQRAGDDARLAMAIEKTLESEAVPVRRAARALLAAQLYLRFGHMGPRALAVLEGPHGWDAATPSMRAERALYRVQAALENVPVDGRASAAVQAHARAIAPGSAAAGLLAQPLAAALLHADARLVGPAAAQNAQRALAARHPESPEVEAFLRAAVPDRAPAGVLTWLGRANARTRAKRLLDLARPREAAALLGALQRAAPTDRMHQLHVEALWKSDQPDAAGAVSDAAVAARPRHAPAHKTRAWLHGKAGDAQAATASWTAAHRFAKRRGDKEEALFFAAFARYEGETYTAAAKAFRACRARYPNGTFAAAAGWYEGLSAWLAGDHEGAYNAWAATLKQPKVKNMAVKLRYWLGRALAEPGAKASAQPARQKAAEGHWRWVARTAPLGYYGHLARARLGLPAPKGIDVVPNALERHARLDADAQALLAIGFHRAAAELTPRAAQRRERLANQLALGNHFAGYRAGPRHWPHPQLKRGGLVQSDGWRASYAMPHAGLVMREAEKAGIAPSFVYAIMRTESGFLPSAESHVGALGLLQLMPYSGRGVAAFLNENPPTRADLLDPATNIHLGAAYLARLNRDFGGLAWAAAAYNGSPKAVAQWRGAFGALEPELFVERVPYKETRNYIKKVLAAEAIYRALSGEELRMRWNTAAPGPVQPGYPVFATHEGA